MSQSITTINALLVNIKTINNSLLKKLQQSGFDTEQSVGYENEYTVRSLINRIDTLTVHFLIITANRDQFIQRTGFTERNQIQSLLKKLYASLEDTQNIVLWLKQNPAEIISEQALSYKLISDNVMQLPMAHSIDYVDALKPYCRMLEMVIAQERIHALSAVLETLLQKDQTSRQLDKEDDTDLTNEQNDALELSHYLIKQAL